jgi:hypothetical protein
VDIISYEDNQQSTPFWLNISLNTDINWVANCSCFKSSPAFIIALNILNVLKFLNGEFK